MLILYLQFYVLITFPIVVCRVIGLEVFHYNYIE